MRRGALVGLIVMVALAMTIGIARADSPTLQINKQIGDIRMGETQTEVAYNDGDECAAGCAGHPDGGCVLGLTKCVGPTYSYDVTGGYLRVGFNNHHVVYIETTSPQYRTSSGLHVGSVIPFGLRYGPFHWHACTPTDGYWIAGTSWKSPLYAHGSARWWTQLAVTKKIVTVVSMWRGDVNVQGC